MDFRQLKYVVAVAEEGGIRAAARRLGVTQPPISHALRMLEEELGVPLMLRSAQGITFTPAGEELVAHAREMLTGLDAIHTAVRRAGRAHASPFRIGLIAGAISAAELLAPIVAAFRDRCGDLELRFEEVQFDDQVGLLRRGELDAVIVRGPLKGALAPRDVHVTPIGEEPRVLFVGPGHDLAAQGRVTAQDAVGFPTLPLTAPDEWSEFWQLDEQRGGSNTASVPPVRTLPQVQLAVATQNVVVSTPASVARLQPHPLVQTVALDDVPRSVIGVAVRRHDARRVVRQFVATAQEAAAAHIGLLPGGVLPS